MGSIAIDTGFIPPTTQRAIIAETGDRVCIREDTPLAPLRSDEFLVRTEALSLNPSDTKMRGDFVTPGAMLGCDYAGTVVARGSAVTGVEIGDRVCGAQYEMNAKRPFRAAFGEYNIPTGPFWMKLPDSITTEGGATYSAAIGTAGLALKLLELPLPDAPVQKPGHVLVYGGGTATATIAIQLLKLVNMIPITACSPVHTERLKSYGAEATFDYHEPDCAGQIKSYTRNNLRYALDCITTVESTALCFAALGRAGGKYVSLDPFEQSVATRKVVKTDWTLGPSLFGEGCVWPEPYARPPSKELLQYGERLWAVAQRLLDEGCLKHHPVRLLKGGLEQVLVGMEMVRRGDLKGEKCVVKLAR
ncbi:uncharacterized protein Z519_04307 [Cladophialophora bantiana CBS 173.52]|uniref:Enoyl reductase (ER) domain-containing protein n=1 Tax=Cladophialophora bantiana (strain ATCC 10958 / CBS 173.52 / CDC B-1940 / NIH 8579) TaxID=1442370 RepID=A0A0D2GAW3_CLAB1|nr:uncharacterized protein Z519_04307 [Cladophialophora bantiana CBS 173.52]KIW95722.1 hypothetical protein Z519_04307 [Cladophialophora bantiana CBS 173.52]